MAASSAIRLAIAVLAIVVLGASNSDADAAAGYETLERKDVCVIGAGPSGVVATRDLLARGYSAIMFDAADEIGGKTSTYKHNGIPYVRHLFTGQMDFLESLLDEYDLNEALRPAGIPQLYLPNGTFVPRPELTPEAMALIQKYVEMFVTQPDLYNEALQKETQDVDFAAFPELALPFREWLQLHGLGGLEPIFWGITSNFGYGVAHEEPAIYLIKENHPLLWANYSVEVVDMAAVFDAMAADIQGSDQGSVRLDCAVTSVKQVKESDDADGAPPAFRVRNKCGRSVVCEQVIAAFPPLPSALDIFKLPDDRLDVFDELEKEHYTEVYVDMSSVSLEDFPPGYYARVWSEGYPERPVIYIRPPIQEAHVHVFFLTAGQVNDNALLKAMKAQLAAMVPNDATESLSMRDIKHVDRWDYFPHANTDALTDGQFYSRFKSEVQGRDGLYFTGGFVNFELVTLSAQAAHRLVHENFPNKTQAA